jgi:hypothetical protein
MSLLTICTKALRRTQIAAPTSIVGNSDEAARLLLECAQDAGEALARWAHPRGGWADLIKEHTFDTVNGTADYALPDDYRALVDGTLWDRDAYWKVRGPLSPQHWQAIKSSALGSGVVGKRFRIRRVTAGLRFSIDPTPSNSTDTIVFEYRSTSWCQSAGGTGQSAWAADTDTGILDEYLIRLETRWRLLEQLGLPYLEAKEESENAVQQAIAEDGGSATLKLDGPTLPFNELGYGSVPETGFGA